jgi:hypothetical protein
MHGTLLTKLIRQAYRPVILSFMIRFAGGFFKEFHIKAWIGSRRYIIWSIMKTVIKMMKHLAKGGHGYGRQKSEEKRSKKEEGCDQGYRTPPYHFRRIN